MLIIKYPYIVYFNTDTFFNNAIKRNNTLANITFEMDYRGALKARIKLSYGSCCDFTLVHIDRCISKIVNYPQTAKGTKGNRLMY